MARPRTQNMHRNPPRGSKYQSFKTAAIYIYWPDFKYARILIVGNVTENHGQFIKSTLKTH